MNQYLNIQKFKRQDYVLVNPLHCRKRSKLTHFKEGEGQNADYTTVDKKAEEAQNIQAEVDASSSLSTKERCVYQGLHHNAKKTQLRDA